MKFSKDTINILKNMSLINNSIKLIPGSMINTKSINSTMYVEQTIEEVIPVTIPIYDLSSFLSSLSLLGEEADIEPIEDDKVIIMKNRRSTIKYNMADESVIISPKKQLKMPDIDVSFKLSNDEFQQITQASRTLGLDTICITKSGTNLIVKVINIEDPTSNTFDLIVGESDNDDEFAFYLNMEYLKLLKLDYTVSISALGAIMFESDTGIKYISSLEANSYYNKG